MTDGLHQQTSLLSSGVTTATTATAATVAAATNCHHHPVGTAEDVVGVSDLLFLEPLTEQSFIDNLRRRFHADKIYTSMGTLLLSVNPYRPLPLYDEAILRTYRTCKTSNLPPHIFGAATAAYRDLTCHGSDQVMILNGECGSGKTEISKLIMDVVASLATKTRESDLINNRLITFGHILAAFGNCKTEKNDNASRFGIYTDVAFNSHGETVGASVITYQLDKSRVVSQSQRERNFHIFYQVLAGADVHLLKSLRLQRNAEKYSLLRMSGVYKIDGLDEKKEFVITKDALDVLGFSASECQSVFQILAAVLKLGNLQFLPKTNVDGTESCAVLNEHEIKEVSELMECSDARRFLSVLTTGFVQMKTGLLEMALSAQEASGLRDQLCKALYNRLFTWIVAKINSCLSYSSSNSRAFLGVLDLYGFECFEKNGFEQLLIDYTSEKLHQFVSDMILKHEQEEYIKEAIPWTNIPYAGTGDVCDLIEKGHHSLLAVLDEVSTKDDQVSGEHLLHKFSKHHPSDRNFLPPLERPTNNVPMDQFKIRHFAGVVTYSSHDFQEKNTDVLNRNLAELMYGCRHALAKELFPDGNPARTIGKRPATMASHIRVSLTSLLNGISTKSLTLITCIKPNDVKRANFFDEEKVKHQLRYMGLVDQVRVRRAGYAFRQSYEGFLKHYKMISQLTWPTWDGDAKDGVRLLLLDLKPEGVMPIEYVFGRTKIFVKYYETIHLMDELRERALENIAVLIQKTFRGYRTRKSASISSSAQSSSQSSKDSNARPVPTAGRVSKLLLRSLYNDQHSSISSSMDSSHSVPYAPYCNNITYPTGGIIMTAIPPTSTAVVTPPIPSSSPIIFRPAIPPKMRNLLSQSSNSIPAMLRIRPTPPLRRTMTVGDHLGGSGLGPDEAAKKITDFFKNYIRYKFLVYLVRHLPNMSPIDQRWPPSTTWLFQTNMILKDIHHRWRCRYYRRRFDQTSICRMREKVVASSIFYGKKATYNRTVPHPFRGDYVRLRQNVKWKKLSLDTNDQYVVFADIMPKIHRSNGKPSYVLAVISTNAFLLIDQRTMIIKYRIQVSDIARISVSPYQDEIVAIHLRPGELFKRKGDFMFQSTHCIEMVTKLCMVIQNCTQKAPEVVIASEFPVHFGSSMVLVHFKADQSTPEFTPDVTPPGSVKILRRSNRMEVTASMDK